MQTFKFEVYRPRGKGWELLSKQTATDEAQAARYASYVHNLKVVGVRRCEKDAKIQTHRLQYVATLASI